MEKLKLPPGFYSNGTEYQGAGRWISGDLIRWHNGVIKPINGWQPRSDFSSGNALGAIFTPGVEAVRSGIAVADNSGGVSTYLGTNAKVYEVSASNIITDVTPSGFSSQSLNASVATGYGLYRYGYGLYGTPRPATDPTIPIVFSWGFSSWGEWPVAVARGIGATPVQIKTNLDADFVDITGSPEGAYDVLVTDERFVMTFGKATDPRLIEWSDREDYEEWTPAQENEAGNERLAGVGPLLRGVAVGREILVLDSNAAFTGSYIGPPYVYSFNRVGSKCGVVGPEAVAVAGPFAMWLGDLSFWRYDGTVSPVDCEVMDYYQKDHNKNQRSKTKALTIADYNEVWWLYQSNSSTGDVDSYIIYNWAHRVWYYGRLDRSFGMDSSPLSLPLMVGTDGMLYDHELVSAGRDGRMPYLTSGPLEQMNGDRLLGIAMVHPDSVLEGAVDMTLSVRDEAGDKPPRYERTFALAGPTSTMGIMGRDIRMTLTGNTSSPTWVVGDFRVDPTKAVTARR